MDDVSNISTVRVFTLSAFSETLNHRVTIFSLTLLCYSVILCVNISLVVIVICDEKLQEPMYILLCVCCVNSLYGPAGFYPKFLLDLMSSSQVVSYGGCLCQAFIMYSFVCSDTSILAAMAYDRYVAICRPLEYCCVMTRRRLWLLACFSWLAPFCIFSFNILLTDGLTFCSVNRLFCVNWVIVRLACPDSDTLVNSVCLHRPLAVYCVDLRVSGGDERALQRGAGVSAQPHLSAHLLHHRGVQSHAHAFHLQTFSPKLSELCSHGRSAHSSGHGPSAVRIQAEKDTQLGSSSGPGQMKKVHNHLR